MIPPPATKTTLGQSYVDDISEEGNGEESSEDDVTMPSLISKTVLPSAKKLTHRQSHADNKARKIGSSAPVTDIVA